MARGISLDVDLARQVGLAPAIVYNELLFWNKKGRRDDGWIYKSYDDMTERLPLSERTIRRAYKSLEEAGLIATKIMKVGETPVLHYKLADSETVILADSIETADLAESSINNKVGNKVDEQKLLKIVNDSVGRNFRTLPSKNVKKVLTTFSLVEIEAALRVLAADDWHAPKLKEFSIDYLIRPTTIDKFLPEQAVAVDKEARARRKAEIDEEMRKFREAD